MKMKLLGYTFTLFMVMIGIKVVQGWDRMPFVQHDRQISAINVNVAEFTENTANLLIKNPNHNDIRNIELVCELIARSETVLAIVGVTAYVQIPSNNVEKYQLPMNSPDQTHSITCLVRDAEILETVNGVIPKEVTLADFKK